MFDIEVGQTYERTDNPNIKLSVIILTPNEITALYWCHCHGGKEKGTIVTEPLDSFWNHLVASNIHIRKEVAPDATDSTGTTTS